MTDEAKPEGLTTGEIRVVDARPSSADKLWDIFLKSLPVLILALFGWGIRLEVTNALQTDDIDENKAEVSRVRDLENAQQRMEQKIEDLKDRVQDLKESADNR